MPKSIEEMVERLAGELPEDYEVNLRIHRDAGWIEVYTRLGSEITDRVELCPDFTLAEQMEQALEACVRDGRNNNE